MGKSNVCPNTPWEGSQNRSFNVTDAGRKEAANNVWIVAVKFMSESCSQGLWRGIGIGSPAWE